MTAKTQTTVRTGGHASASQVRRAFTLVEVLIVMAIIGVLITILGATVRTTLRKTREAATTTLLQKIDGLLEERNKGFERATKSRDFQTIVNNRKLSLEAAGVFGVSTKVIAAIARKDFYRQLFPQRFEDLGPDVSPANGVPDVLDAVPGVNVTVLATQTGANRHATESSEILYFALTRMQSFGVPPVAESEFGDTEVRDTDGDGLMEFVDAWGQPLRFYRWPTRLLKPNGAYGADGAPGNGGASFLVYGTLGSDDVALALAPRDMRPVAGLLIAGLVRQPAFPASQWDTLSEDPDDPYGLITTEMKRLVASGTNAPATYNETSYPTLDTYHTSLVVSVGADGVLGLYEPYVASDVNGDGLIDYGTLAQPEYDATIAPASPYNISSATIAALTDNLTNRNRRAGKAK